MNELEETKFKLIEKSITALNKSIRSIELLDMLTATEMYNTVLIAFESLQIRPENYKEDDIIEIYLEELEEEHKKIIEIFETGSLETLSSIMKEEIIGRYTAMKDYYDEKEFCSKNNINMDSTFYKKIKDCNLLEDMNQDVIDEIQEYWEKYSKKKIDPTTNLAFYNLTGRVEPRVISQREFNTDVWLMLNDQEHFKFYEDKNVYDLLIESEHAPDTILKRVNGQYFDQDSKTISRGDAFKIFYNIKEDIIVKESRSNDAKGVEKIYYRKNVFYFNKKKVDLRNIEDIWGKDIIIQRVIKQHPMMAQPHKHSVNTFRMITLRWDNQINYLMTYAKFGVDGSIKDNESDFIGVPVSEEGKFADYGISHRDGMKIYKEHPTTGFKFKELGQVPNFDEYIELIKRLHDRILHQNYVTWDIAMGANGKPIFIEMNFRGAVWSYQFISEKPLFGEYTEDILTKAVERREKIEEQQRLAQEKREAQAKAQEVHKGVRPL